MGLLVVARKSILMPTARFYLKNEVDSLGKQHIVMKYAYTRGRRLTYHSGKAIEAKHWSKERQRAKKSYPNAKALNRLLDSIAVAVERIHLEAQAAGKAVTKEYFIEQLDSAIKKRPTTTRDINLITFAEEMYNIKRRSAFSNLVNQLKKFKRRRAYSFDFDAIDYNFYIAFEQFLIDQGFRDSYSYGIVKVLKQTVREAVRRGYTTNSAILNIKSTLSDYSPEKVILSAEEVKHLISFQPPKRLEVTKQLLICACLTGLAFVDWPQLDTVDSPTLQAGGYTFVQISSRAKTGERAFAPVLSYTQKVLDQHGGQLPEANDVVFNRYAKELAELAGLTDQVVLLESKGGKRTQRKTRKCDEITTMTGRRTWNSLLRQNGLPDHFIKHLMGHSSKDMTDLYDHRTFEVVAEQIAPFLDEIEDKLAPDYDGPRFV